MKTKHILQILLLSAVWGISFLMIRIAASTFPPIWVGFLRSTSGALLMITVLKIGGYKLPPRRLFPWLFLVALFNNAIPFCFFAWGEQTVPSNTAAVLNATLPIWTLLIGLAVHRGRAGMTTILGILTGFAGVSLVVYSRASDPAQTQGSLALGIVVIVLAVLGYAVATTIAKAKLQGLDPVGLTTTQLGLASLMLSPVAFFTQHPAHLQWAPVLAILVLGLAGSGIAYLIYYSLLAHIPATHVVAVTYLLPVWGIFWGLVAGETISPLAYVGVGIVIAGLMLMNMRLQPSPKPQALPATD